MTGGTKLGHVLGVSLALTGAVFGVPWLMVTPMEPSVQPTLSTPIQPEQTSTPLPSADLDDALSLQVLHNGAVVDMTLGDYLIGVVSAEMPASFELEALKAQACAARTYTLYQMQTQGNHDQADVCTDSTCCQAYIDQASAADNWGTMAETYASRIRAAVQSTNGETIDYGGAPILAVFHSSSATQTRQAGDVWVSDLPYLQSVSSPETSETVPDYQTQVTYSLTELAALLQSAVPQGDFSTPGETWLSNPVVEEGGSVQTLSVGGVTVTGTALRTALSLRSACFTWHCQDDAMVFTVTGYGHGVGLSQYGANTMAQQGADYLEILNHYYTGVTIDTQCVATMANTLQ